MNLHFFVLLAQLSFSSQPFRIFSLIFHSLGHAKGLGSSYDVMSATERPKMAEVDRVISLLVFISLMSQVCIDSCRILCSFLQWIFLNKDLKNCAFLIREMGKMQAIWEFSTSKELKIGKIFVLLTIQCGR